MFPEKKVMNNENSIIYNKLVRSDSKEKLYFQKHY